MSEVTLTEISRINEHMKYVLKESRHLYRVSLNAMFASRRIKVGIEGFVEVTSLLRHFSDQLDSRVSSLSGSVNEAIQCMVILSIAKNRVRLTNKAIKLAHLQNVRLTLHADVSKLLNESGFIIDRINSDIERCLKLIRVGENLTVLAKVEANSVPVQVGDLDSITKAMDGIMFNINNNIMNTRNYIC